MWLVSRTGVFTYFCFFFLAKRLGNWQYKKKNKKNQTRNLQKGKRFDNDGKSN